MKDELEIQNVRKAIFFCASILRIYVVSQLKIVIDEEKAITHAELMDDLRKAILDPSKAKVKLKPDNVVGCLI